MRFGLIFLMSLFATAGGVQGPAQKCEAEGGRCAAAPVLRVPQLRPCISRCEDWEQFSDAAATTQISEENIRQLRLRWRIPMNETIEGSPLHVERASTILGVRNLVIVSTATGRLIALDASTGARIWSTTPPAGPRWTTSSPALDPGRAFVYAYGLDGYVHKYSIASGAEIKNDGWPQLITLKGDVEKGSSAIAIATTNGGQHYLYMTIAAYPEPGDDGDYQGHLVSIDLDRGQQHVFNAECSDNARHFVENGDPSSDCSVAQAGIWARAGAVYDRRTDRVYVTTGNGVFDADRGGFNWATSVVALPPDGATDGGTPLDTYTPVNYQYLNDQDLDLSSTTVAPLMLASASSAPPLAVQGGKDGVLRLLNLGDLSGQGGPRHIGGELQQFRLPQGGWIITRPVAWLDGARSYVAVANDQGISAFILDEEASPPKLVQAWTTRIGCQSPVYANGLLVCAQTGTINAFSAKTGELAWSDDTIENIHWQSPIVVGNSVFVADSSGLYAYSLP